MKTRYIVGAILLVGFIILAFTSFSQQKIDYADFAYAKAQGKTFQVKGYWVKENKYTYDPAKNLMSFNMKDTTYAITKVEYQGAPPNNFDMATSVVVKGKFVGDVFKASEILTQCPSKYDANSVEPQKAN
ncbi:MAG: cytochrome c maturation protein CcmE [Candidatus Kapabacteria bacterium]|nr:cytochrome c maturation protein CcmE [Candidatus Kapabacteria bacterium]